ncbi:MAG: LPS translocon maturation chaperone LptM [Hyphomicrobiaceae bacterium]
MSGKAQIIAACLALGAIALAGCGVRGSLELPPEAAAGQQKSASADSGQGKPAGAAPKPHQGFILDKLLQ